MRPMADDNDGTLAFEAVVERACVPTVKLPTNSLRARVRHRAKRIVDQGYVRSAPVERATNTDRIIAAALRCIPTPARLAVLSELHVKIWAYSSAFMRFRTSRPKSSASAKLAD